tara:strand:- start:836 stop:1210 length:375 start_codon:yes stop_codon:yes gene_type:complete
MNQKHKKLWGVSEKKEKEKKPRVNQTHKSEIEENGVEILRVNYFIQSIVYLLGASLYQTQKTIRQGLDMPFIEHFMIAFSIFGLFSWALLSGVLYLINRKKPKEEMGNITLYMGMGFIAIYLLT